MSGRPPIVVRLAFLGAGQGMRPGRWNEAVGRHTRNVFTSLAIRSAVRRLREEIDRARGGALDLRVAGYSWGAWTSLHLAAVLLRHPHRIHPSLGHDDVRIRMGLLDPVATLRRTPRLVMDDRIDVMNVFQRNGCYRGCPGPSGWFAGRAIEGARVNRDVTEEGRGLPMQNGVPPERAPDHIQMGYTGWGDHDLEVAAVLAPGPGEARPPTAAEAERLNAGGA